MHGAATSTRRDDRNQSSRTRRSRTRSSLRRVLLTVLAAASTLAGSLTPAADPAPALAAPPVSANCQVGFLEAARPAQAECRDDETTKSPALAAPAGFQESVVWSGLTNPMALRFAADGRVFVAEKSGVIKIFDNLSDPTPTTYSGLMTNVHNYWDRGLLGLALDPSLTGGSGNGSWLYVLYAYDHLLTGGPVGSWNDGCVSPPGPTTDGCVISGRLSRFAVSGSSITGSEQVLIEDWCQQYPSHSVGSLNFGPDGALYVTGGDGASFNVVDYGQLGGTIPAGGPYPTQKNPCADPGGAMTPPSAEGGALRSQDMRTTSTGGGGGGTYVQAVLADSPLAYYRLGEASGSTMVDQTNNHPGTYVGSPTFGQTGALPGDTDKSIALSGSGSAYGQVAAWTTAPAPPASIEAWIRHNGTDWTIDTTIAGSVNPGTRALRLMAFGNGVNTIELGIYTEQGNAHWNWVPAGNTGWHHVVGVINAAGNSATLYFDGAQVATGSVSYAGGSVSQPFRIGTGSDSGAAGTESWPGGIDEVAVYGSALATARVQAHFAASTGGGGPPTTEPVTLDGAVLRVDPNTGAGLAGNPFFSNTDANARRIIATGLRNPFRSTFRPGTGELWVGDVGWSTWEEINRIPVASDATAENFGWPCYEGSPRQGGYDATNLTICENLYAAGSAAHATPTYAYDHAASVVAGDGCPTGSSSISGLAFYPETGGSFPASYAGGLFFADYSRKCIWFMARGANGQPNPAQRQAFVTAGGGPVDLAIGPGGHLFYPDFDGGSIRRVSATGGNQPPTAVMQALADEWQCPADRPVQRQRLVRSRGHGAHLRVGSRRRRRLRRRDRGDGLVGLLGLRQRHDAAARHGRRLGDRDGEPGDQRQQHAARAGHLDADLRHDLGGRRPDQLHRLGIRQPGREPAGLCPELDPRPAALPLQLP